jgi:extracellular factor (EF) 3-hydroxypalmitic acid methyl ester biosynthesis protein
MSSPELTPVEVVVRLATTKLISELRAIEASLADQSDDDLFQAVAAALDQCLAACSSTGVWGQANQLPSSVLWNMAGPLLERGWLLNRARTKPRGYAGDYELLARIYENRLCNDPLGRLLDRYFQGHTAPVAVRNRMAMIADWIAEEARGPVGGPQGAHAPRSPLKVAVVGSAFGLEIRAALARLDARQRQAVTVKLIDVDPAALDFARDRLAELLPPERIATASANLFRLPERPRLAEPLAGSDLLFCPGLFDYLDDAAAAAMLGLFWQLLAPGGRLVVFQFAPHNPSRALMEWIGNWYLIYRDEQSLRSVAAAAGFPAQQVKMGAEAQGVNLYLSATQV